MNFKMLPSWTAIAAFFGFTGDVTSKEITVEMISQMNDRMAEQTTRLETIQAENTRLVQVEQNFNTLQAIHTETVSQFEAFKAQDAGSETTAGKPADRTAEQLISDQYSYNKLADQQS